MFAAADRRCEAASASTVGVAVVSVFHQSCAYSPRSKAENPGRGSPHNKAVVLRGTSVALWSRSDKTSRGALTVCTCSVMWAQLRYFRGGPLTLFPIIRSHLCKMDSQALPGKRAAIFLTYRLGFSVRSISDINPSSLVDSSSGQAFG